MKDFIKLKFFNSIAEAELAKNLLKENNIKSMISKKGMEFPGDMGDSFGADLFVIEKDFKKADKIINYNC